jgi:hypothetical protein
MAMDKGATLMHDFLDIKLKEATLKDGLKTACTFCAIFYTAKTVSKVAAAEMDRYVESRKKRRNG